MFIVFSMKNVRGGFKLIDLANAVILVSVFFENIIFFTKTCWDVGFSFFSMILCQNGCKVLSIRGMDGKSGILDPIKLDRILEMYPKSPK